MNKNITAFLILVVALAGFAVVKYAFPELMGSNQLAQVLTGATGGSGSGQQNGPGLTTCSSSSPQGRIYVMNGHGDTQLAGSTSYQDVWELNPATGSWTQKATTTPIGPRVYGQMIFFQNKLWFMGGSDTSGIYKNDVWTSSDGGATWTQFDNDTVTAGIQNAPWSKRIRFGAIVHNRKLWIMGGRYDSTGTNLHSVWNFDGITWTKVDNIPSTTAIDDAQWSARNGFSLVEFDGKMYVMGGTTNTGTAMLSDVWVYDDVTGMWSVVGTAPWSTRMMFGAVGIDTGTIPAALGGKIWVMAGNYLHLSSSSYSNETWNYNITSGWTHFDSSPLGGTQDGPYHVRNEFNAHFANGKIWMFGGSDTGIVNLHSVERFYNDVWNFDGTTWAPQPNAPWLPRDGYESAYGCAIPTPPVTQLTLDKILITDNTASTGIAPQVSAWTLTATGPTTISGPGAGGSADVVSGPTFQPGTYTLSESGGLPGYTASAWTCTNGITVNAQNQITLTTGQSTVCTITNNDTPPQLTLNKIVINDNGGTAQPSAWTLTATGPTTISGPGASGSADVVSGPTFVAGRYTLSESTGPANYTASTWSCTNGVTVNASNQITLGLGQTTTCTITNNDTVPACFDNNIYMLGGHGGGPNTPVSFKDVWALNPTSGTWSLKNANAPFGTRNYASLISFQCKLWLFGGSTDNGVYTNQVWTSTDGVTWTQQSNAPWLARIRAAAVVLNNKLWLIGGRISATGTSVGEVWSFNGTTWTQFDHDTVTPGIQNAPWTARNGVSAVVQNGNIVIAGGATGPTSSTVNSEVWKFSGVSGTTWTPVDNDPVATGVQGNAPWTARYVFGSDILGSTLWVMGGGLTNGNTFNDSWSFDGTTWTHFDSSATAGIQDGPYHIRNEFDARTTIGNKIWLFGGSYLNASGVENFLNDVWNFDGTTWAPQPNAPWLARDGYASTVFKQ